MLAVIKAIYGGPVKTSWGNRVLHVYLFVSLIFFLFVESGFSAKAKKEKHVLNVRESCSIRE